jgi:hypothetical protein
MTDEVPREPLFLPSIHGELLCITAATCSNSSEFMPSQVHYEPLHPVYAIFHTKINPNFRKISELYINTPTFLRNFVPIPSSK